MNGYGSGDSGLAGGSVMLHISQEQARYCAATETEVAWKYNVQGGAHFFVERYGYRAGHVDIWSAENILFSSCV